MRAIVLGLAIASLLLAGGCATVRPEEKEILARRSMTFGSDAEVMAQEDHVLTNREGTAGGNATTGGGCGCN